MTDLINDLKPILLKKASDKEELTNQENVLLKKKNCYKFCNPASRLFNYKVHLKSKRWQYIGSWVENGCNFENISQKFKSVIYCVQTDPSYSLKLVIIINYLFYKTSNHTIHVYTIMLGNEISECHSKLVKMINNGRYNLCKINLFTRNHKLHLTIPIKVKKRHRIINAQVIQIMYNISHMKFLAAILKAK